MTSSRFEGSILGLAIGDALGFPTEFRSREKILAAFGPRGVTDFVAVHDERWSQDTVILGGHAAGTYSDDTQMTIAVARGLLEAGVAADLDSQMNAIAKQFVTWSTAPDNDRAPGATCLTGTANLARGVEWREAGVAESKGCGSAMRVAPIGLLYASERAKLIEVAEASSLLTHGHPAALDGAAAAALLIAYALEDVHPSEMIGRLGVDLDTNGRELSVDFTRRLDQLEELVDQPPARVLSDAGLGEAWVAEEAVVSALYCVCKNPDDFAATVLMATNTDGDSDSIAAIAGSISGARLGIEAIPPHWRKAVENSESLTALSHELFAMTR